MGCSFSISTQKLWENSGSLIIAIHMAYWVWRKGFQQKLKMTDGQIYGWTGKHKFGLAEGPMGGQKGQQTGGLKGSQADFITLVLYSCRANIIFFILEKYFLIDINWCNLSSISVWTDRNCTKTKQMKPQSSKGYLKYGISMTRWDCYLLGKLVW